MLCGFAESAQPIPEMQLGPIPTPHMPTLN